ncbi:MAG: TIGR04063 family PEP-CTERM/XrtA system glycosyltransferase [Gammaproteobacteria bacterium]
MKILHVFDHSIPLHSGYTFRSAALLREQRALGWETHHLTSPRQGRTESAQDTVDGLVFRRSPAVPAQVASLPVVAQVADMALLRRRLDEVVREIRPDVLHAHSPVLNAWPTLSVGRRHDLPVVYEVRAFWEDAAVDHGTTQEGSLRYRATHALETAAFRRADAVTCICEGLRRDIVARGIPAEKVTVIPNAVDPETFQYRVPPDAGLAARLGLTGCRVLGFVGSFYAYEGLDLLLTALPALRARDPDIRLLLVGGGPQEANLKRQVDALGLADCVIFTGRVPHAEVGRYYSLIDCLVYARHPMRLTELVTPLKPLEAMAQGRNFIASDIGGHRELIRHGDTGILFEAGSAPALAEAALDLLHDAGKQGALREAGRRFVESERTWQRSVARYRDVYAAAIARRAARAMGEPA